MKETRKEKLPLEIERKYLIEYPDTNWLDHLENCQKVEIVQTYLVSKLGDTSRVRLWRTNGVDTYYKTMKRKLTELSRVELEEEISLKEYEECLKQADPECHPIEKVRYRLMRDGKCFEIDLFSFWRDRAVLEIELESEEEEVPVPQEFHVIREVTFEPEYKNSNMARNRGLK